MLPQLTLFGEAVLESPAGRVTLRGGKSSALLVYLALQGGWVRREAMMALFWPEASETAARANLRQLLVGLRRSPHVMGLGAGLEVTNAALCWRVPTDVAAFRERLAAGDVAGAAAYRDELLGAFNLGGLGSFAEWVEAEREALARAFRDAALMRAHGHRQAGAFAEAAEVLGFALQRDPLDEDVLAERLEALLHAKRYRPALAEYAAFCKRLEREYGGVPGTALRALEARLRAEQGKEPSAAPVAPPLPPPPPDTSPVSPFVGRERELKALGAHLADPAVRLLSLVGPGGVGKTRLTLALADRHGGGFRDGVTVARLETLADPALVAPALAALLGVPPTDEPYGEQVAAFLERRECLLVLDNFEQLLGATPFLERLLNRAPGLRLVVSSREPLGAAQETVLELRGLSLEDGEGSPDAVALFLHGAARAGATLRPGDAGTVADICALVGGVPLALELTSAWLRLLSPAEVRAELAGGLDLLAWPDAGLPERHRNMRRVLAGSWERLNDEEQRGLARLSVFRGGFSFGAAKTAAKLSPNVLLTLLRRSLVYREGDGRFSLHEVVRHYAAEQLAGTGGPERVQTEHARYYLGLLGSLEMWSDKEPAWLATLDVELPNVRAAWEFAVRGEKLPEFWRPNDVVIFFDRRMRYAEGLELLTAASGCFSPADEAHRETLAALSIDRAWLLFRLGRYAEAEALAQAALDGSRDKKLRMKALNTLGIVARQGGDYPKAAERLEGALALAQELGEVARAAAYLNNLSATFVISADDAGAEKAALAALQLHRTTGDHYGIATTLNDLSSIQKSRANYRTALELVEEALEIASSRGFGDLVPICLLGQAFILYQTGEFSRVESVCSDVLRMSSESMVLRSSTFNLLGRVTARRGETARARDYLREGFLIAWRYKDVPVMLENMVALAELEFRENAFGRAYRLARAIVEHPAASATERRDADRILTAVSGTSSKHASAPELSSLERWVPAFLGLEGEISTTPDVN